MPIATKPHRFQRAPARSDSDADEEAVDAAVAANKEAVAPTSSSPPQPTQSEGLSAAEIRALRLRPRERSAEEIAAAAAAAAAAPPRRFQGPPPEKVLSQAAAPWLRRLGRFMLAATLVAGGYLAGYYRHEGASPAPPVVNVVKEKSPAGATAPGNPSSAPTSGTAVATRSRERQQFALPPGGPSSLLTQPVPSTAAGASSAVETPSARLSAWSDAEFTALDAALTAERSGNRAKAVQLTTELRGRLGQTLSQQSSALDLYLAEMAIRERRGRDAKAILFPLTRTSPPSAQACDRLGFIAARNRDFDDAVTAFSEAAKAEPLVGVYFYRWGECLRRQGKLEEAVTRLQEALLRQRGSDPLTAPAATGLKLRLARIELGQVAAVRAEAEEHTRNNSANQAPPPDAGDWMLAAAACDLQENKLAAAAEWLRKARAALPAARFEEEIADYFFRAYLHKPELASALPTAAEMDARRQMLASRPEVYFVDP